MKIAKYERRNFSEYNIKCIHCESKKVRLKRIEGKKLNIVNVFGCYECGSSTFIFEDELKDLKKND